MAILCTSLRRPPAFPVSSKKKGADVERCREVRAAVHASCRHVQLDGGQLIIDGALQRGPSAQRQLARRVEPECGPVWSAERARQQPGAALRWTVEVSVEELLLVAGGRQGQRQLDVVGGQPGTLCWQPWV